jgi:hypothetical protein
VADSARPPIPRRRALCLRARRLATQRIVGLAEGLALGVGSACGADRYRTSAPQLAGHQRRAVYSGQELTRPIEYIVRLALSRTSFSGDRFV